MKSGGMMVARWGYCGRKRGALRSRDGGTAVTHGGHYGHDGGYCGRTKGALRSRKGGRSGRNFKSQIPRNPFT